MSAYCLEKNSIIILSIKFQFNLFFNLDTTGLFKIDLHVELPRSQTLLSEKERSHLPDIFAEALLDPTDPPIAEDIPNILKKYGHSFLQNRTKHLIESDTQEDRVLTKALVDLILDEIEEWDGSLSEDLSADAKYIRHQAYLRLCLRLYTWKTILKEFTDIFEG